MRRSNRLQVLRLIAVTLLTAGFASAAAGVVVIGNPQLPSTDLSSEQAKDLYLGKARSLADGSIVRVIDQEEGNASREEFYQKIIGKTDAQLKAYWAKLVFTGKGSPPKMLADDAAVKEWVAETPGGIGYVDESAVDDSVQVLLRP